MYCILLIIYLLSNSEFDNCNKPLFNFFEIDILKNKYIFSFCFNSIHFTIWKICNWLRIPWENCRKLYGSLQQKERRGMILWCIPSQINKRFPIGKSSFIASSKKSENTLLDNNDQVKSISVNSLSVMGNGISVSQTRRSPNIYNNS